MPAPYPPATRWVQSFAEGLNRAIGDVYGWDLYKTEDPLTWVLHLRLTRSFDPIEKRPVRDILKSWAEANDCVYRKSLFDKRDFRALVIVKGWGPESNVTPT